jgi:hypothetical protein
LGLPEALQISLAINLTFHGKQAIYAALQPDDFAALQHTESEQRDCNPAAPYWKQAFATVMLQTSSH